MSITFKDWVGGSLEEVVVLVVTVDVVVMLLLEDCEWAIPIIVDGNLDSVVIDYNGRLSLPYHDDVVNPPPSVASAADDEEASTAQISPRPRN